MAISTTALKFAKWLYWIILLGALLCLCYFVLYLSGRALAAILTFVFGCMLVFLMYWVYFPAGDAETKWPPFIRGCPDYLTSIAPGKCVDYVGVGSGMLKKADPQHPPAPTDTAYVFDATGTRQQKNDNAALYGLTWEGITSQ